MRRVLRRNRGKRLQAKLMDVKNDLQRRSHPTKMTTERLKPLIYHWSLRTIYIRLPYPLRRPGVIS
ncbi:MAG: hypothetical protein R3B95_08550 [Nitrospirales bacterium]|nr:hypothetical protein [Nitrospirales bacterium]